MADCPIKVHEIPISKKTDAKSFIKLDGFYEILPLISSLFSLLISRFLDLQ